VLILFLTGCAGDDPEALALKACQAMPGLAVDAAALSLTRELVVPTEWAAWKAAPWGRGLERIGPAGYGVIRANSDCRVDVVEPAAEGWRARVVRGEPVVDPHDFSIDKVMGLDLAEQDFFLDIVDTTEGLRVRVGLEAAQGRHAAAEKALAAGRWGEAAGAWLALREDFPDPMLLWDVAEARGRIAVKESLVVTRAEEGEGLRVTHAGPREAEVRIAVSVGEERVEVGPVVLYPEIELDVPLASELPGEGPLKVELLEVTTR